MYSVFFLFCGLLCEEHIKAQKSFKIILPSQKELKGAKDDDDGFENAIEKPLL